MSDGNMKDHYVLKTKTYAVEVIDFLGESRFRLWIPSFWLAPNWVSTGETFKSTREAIDSMAIGDLK